MPTRCLFHDNAYIAQFEAKLLDWTVKERFIEVILDQTAFYPTSGGQPHDTGTINGLEVSDVLWQDKNVVHVFSRQYEDEIKRWKFVKGQIDWNRRFDHMQHHTGQHLLSRSFMEVIPGAETVSFHLTDSSVHIDVAVPSIQNTALNQIQELANKWIFQDVEIKTYFTSREAAAQKKLRKGVETIAHEQVRIVEIDNFDIDPCGGTHCNRSGEVGLILIEDVKKAGKRGSRIRFLCGWRALRVFTQTNRLMKGVQELLKCEHQAIPELIQSMQHTIREKEKTIRVLKNQIQAFEIEHYIHEAKASHSRIITQIFDDRDPESAKQIALGIVEAHSRLIPIFGIQTNPSNVVMARSDKYPGLDLREILKEGLKEIEGRGGGTETLIQAGGINLEDLDRIITVLEQLILQKI